MKNRKTAGLCVAVCAACGLLFLPAAETGITAQAAEVIATVEGKVMEGTTAKLLYLDTSDGKMEIKIDADTGTGNCKILLPKKKVSVSVANGNDGYLHAVTISESGENPSVSLDTSTVSSVVGTVNAKTTEEVLHLDTAQGEMELKLDRDTDFSNCSVLVVSGKYVVRCARGEDAYMHVLSIADVAAAPAGDTMQVDASLQADTTDRTYVQAPVTNATGETRSVTGTVRESTNESVLNLGTSEGDFTFMIDETTNTSAGMILTPENKLMVTYFRGSDNNLHASALTGVKDSSSAALDDSASAAVTGTVNKKSTENVLVLDTSAGEMELKLDKVESLSGCKVLVAGKKVSVTCKRGNDAYMHALTITAAK